ncbi:MAG: hypothetical protein GYA24_20415 [Candidatus Lokiarchaeota archaeon]|nr:hypothetical protein [Candidatus Lokiarchaeota archaeon]
MLPQADIEAVLGIEESEILKAIHMHPGDEDSIHLMTGIPVPCIKAKVAALVELGYVVHTATGYEAAPPRRAPR